MKEGEKLNKESVLITSDVIQECLCESFDIAEKKTPSHSRIKESSK
ncbi:MAG TPA: hypothetical protein VIK78_06095 [Ruminiclostridium sp.]